MEHSCMNLVQDLLDRKKTLKNVNIPAIEDEISNVKSIIDSMRKDCNHILCRTGENTCYCIACGYTGHTFPDGLCFGSVCIVENKKVYNVYKKIEVIPEVKKHSANSYKSLIMQQEDRLRLLKINLTAHRKLIQKIDEELYTILNLICSEFGLKYEEDTCHNTTTDIEHD